MTVPATSRKAGPYTGTGATGPFPFSFKIFAITDVKVVVADLTGAETTLSSGYTVSMNADQVTSPGGSVSITAGLTTGYKATLLGNLPYDQTLALPGGGNFNPVAIENALDRTAEQIQQLAEASGRALSLPASSTAGGALPSPVALALIGWNAAGTALQNFTGAASALVSTFMTPIVAAVDAATALAGLGFSSFFRTLIGAADGLTLRTLIGAAASAVNSDITKLTGVTDYSGSLRFWSHLGGLTLSTAGASATMTIAPGAAMDSTNTVLIQNAAALSKNTSAWVAGSGNGGLDTGAIKPSAFGATCSFATNVMTCTVAPSSGTFQVGQVIVADGMPANTTIASLGTGAGGTGTYNLSTSPGTLAARPAKGLMWYHAHAMRRPDTGAVDGAWSLSPTAPTTGGNIPAAFTQFRNIGAMATDGNAQWLPFIQDGDEFQWLTTLLDVNITNPGTSRVSATLSVPTGVNVTAVFNAQATDTSGAIIANYTDLAVNAATPSATAAPLGTSTSLSASTSAGMSGINRVRTNTSAQIGFEVQSSAATTTVRIATRGWIHPRGKNA